MTWTWGRQNISDGIYILINLTIYYIINGQVIEEILLQQ